MKHKILNTVLVCLFALIGLHASAYNIYVDGIYYNLNDKVNEATVTFMEIRENEKAYVGSIVIPSVVTTNQGKTYKVTGIGANAFYGCRNMTSISIPNSITSIGDNAFERCSGLTTITIPASVTTIGDYVFQGCI